MDARERKKERILMLSMQRKQQQEEQRLRNEQEAQLRREREKEKEEEKARKKEEQTARRAAILEQHKLKKAIEEAEREVCIYLYHPPFIFKCCFLILLILTLTNKPK